MGPLTLSLAVGLLGAPTTVDVAAGVDLRGRAGQMTVRAGSTAQPATDWTTTLLSGIRIKSETTTFELGYRPQYYYQVPNAIGSPVPLALHRLNSNLTAQFSPRTSLNWNSTGAIGSLSYSMLLQPFPDGTAAALGGIIPLVTGTSSASLAHQLSRRHSLAVTVNAGYRAPLDNQNQNQLPNSVNFGASVTDSYRVNKRDQIATQVFVGRIVQHRKTNGRLGYENNYVGLSVGWDRKIDLQSTFSATAGVAAALPDQRGGHFSPFPIFLLGYSNRSRSLGTTWQATLRGGAQGYFDPLLARYRPRALLQASLQGQHGRDLTTSTSFFAASSLTSEPVTPSEYETTLSFVSNVNYSVTDAFSVNGGVSWFARAGHWSTFNTPQPQNQILGFVGLRWAIGTGEGNGGWL